MNYEVGERIGDYQVVDRVGAGGMGAVYKVRNLITDRIDALKVLLPDLRQAPDLAERFSREIKVHASLVHPNIAALHTAMRVENQLLMIMEFVEGTSLSTRLRQGPMQCQESVACILQVLSALSYAHERGIIHRDIKPANIMVTPSRHVKLMDFGIATRTGTGALQNRLTAAGMALGSVHYMSPEQVKAGAPDGRSDLYSLGITFYEMVTGQCPIRGNSEYEIMAAHLAIAPPSPIELNPFLPPPVAAIIIKAIQKRPDDRFQTAAEFSASLEALSGAPATPMHMQPSTRITGAVPELPVRPPTPPSGTSILNPAIVEATVKDLAVYIGPMAKIIVNRASKKAQSPKELYEAVALEITSVTDRTKFLAKRGT
jgi:serine/threonine protein kinase